MVEALLIAGIFMTVLIGFGGLIVWLCERTPGIRK